MARHLKTYSDEIKLRIYKKLSEHEHKFTELSAACRINQVTLSEYLLHAQEMSEVERDPRTKQYNLTPKGQETIQRILNAEAAKDHPIWFQNRVDSEGDLEASDLAGPFSEETTPLPIPVEVTIYGTEELRSDFSLTLVDALAQTGNIGPRKVPKAKLRLMTGRWAMNFVWGLILPRLFELLDRHHDFKKNARGEQPPPLTLDNILGFDASLTIRYEGKKLVRSQDIQQAHQASRRLIGALLLRLAGGWFFGWDPFSLSAPIPLLERGGLLERKDARRLHQILTRKKYGGNVARWHPTKADRTTILEIASKYLKEGGVLTPKRTMFRM